MLQDKMKQHRVLRKWEEKKYGQDKVAKKEKG